MGLYDNCHMTSVLVQKLVYQLLDNRTCHITNCHVKIARVNGLGNKFDKFY